MRLTLISLVLVACAGCTISSRAIQSDFADFNQALHRNQSQQMLLNLVRMKYRETPLFLKVGALSSSYEVEGTAEASFLNASSLDTQGLRLGSSFSSRPTITYTPLEGTSFVSQVLAEIDPETFALLVRSGWPIRTLCSVMLERLDHQVNNEDDPSYERFTHLVEALAEAQDAGKLRFLKSDDELMMEVISTREVLHDPGSTDIERVHHVSMASALPRSMQDLMFFLGKNTHVPEEHLNQVREGRMNGWITIRSSEAMPDDALVWVRHNGYYFSIARDDIRSKDTFALVKLLFQIQAGDIRSVQPVLTLPVATP